MLNRLHELLRGPLQAMLADPAHPWKTVDVTYEDPHVERVWTQWGEDRVNLHRIHPCEKALFHPHPWPSAMLIVDGEYEMGIGHGRDDYDGEPLLEVATVRLAAGSEYEMVNRLAWHWVRPLTMTMSVMLTGKPWELPEHFPKHGKRHEHRELTDATRDSILNYFRRRMAG